MGEEGKRSYSLEVIGELCDLEESLPRNRGKLRLEGIDLREKGIVNFSYHPLANLLRSKGSPRIALQPTQRSDKLDTHSFEGTDFTMNKKWRM